MQTSRDRKPLKGKMGDILWVFVVCNVNKYNHGVLKLMLLIRSLMSDI